MNIKAKGLAALFVAAIWLQSPAAHASGAVSQQIFNPTGGTSQTDGIRAYIGSNSQVQVVGWSQITSATPGAYPQMYLGCGSHGCTGYGTPLSGTMYNTVALRLEPVAGTSRIYANTDSGGITGSLPFDQTSQSGISGTGTPADPYTVTTTLNPSAPDAGITVKLIDTYVYPDPFFSRRIELTGLPATEQVKLYWYIDTYLAGGDSGYGLSKTSVGNTTGIPDFIGVTKPGVLQGIQNTAGMPLWNHYFSGYWSDPAGHISSAGGDLSDQIDSTYKDNGIAVQWNVPSGQTTFTVATGQTYGSSATVSESYSPNSIPAGQTSTLSFTFQHFDSAGTTLTGLSSSYTLPTHVTVAPSPALVNGCVGSTVTTTGGVIAISSVSIDPAGNPADTCTVSLAVTSATPGLYNGTLASSGAGLTTADSGNRTLEVKSKNAPSAATPVPLLTPLALLLLAGMTGWLGMRRRAS